LRFFNPASRHFSLSSRRCCEQSRFFCHPSGKSSDVFDPILVLPQMDSLAWVRLAGPRAASIVACALMMAPVAAALRLQAGSPDVVTMPGGRWRRAKRIFAASTARAVVRRLAGAMAAAARLHLY
jgi:hypothetical protein